MYWPCTNPVFPILILNTGSVTNSLKASATP
jgi:hypothetical protein